MMLPETYIAGFHDEQAVRRMPYTLLGKTGLTVSKLSFGAGTLSGIFTYTSDSNNECDEQEAVNIVREAIRLGINYIDTAPAYGQGRSERILGKALSEIPRKAYYISTKVSRYNTTDWTTAFDHSAQAIKSGFDKSLSLLGLDYVDIVYVHDIEFASMEQILYESLPAVAQLVEEKRARHIGVSGYPLSLLKHTIESSTCSIDLVLSYARETLFDISLQDYLQFFKSKNLGVVNAAPTGMGLLTNAGPPAWHPALPQLKQLCADAANYAKEQGVELGRLAVWSALQQPGYHTLLIGTAQLLHSNLLLVYEGLTGHELAVLAEIRGRYFVHSPKLHWEGSQIAEYRAHTALQKCQSLNF